jgi:hypothetical protein
VSLVHPSKYCDSTVKLAMTILPCPSKFIILGHPAIQHHTCVWTHTHIHTRVCACAQAVKSQPNPALAHRNLGHEGMFLTSLVVCLFRLETALFC